MKKSKNLSSLKNTLNDYNNVAVSKILQAKTTLARFLIPLSLSLSLVLPLSIINLIPTPANAARLTTWQNPNVDAPAMNRAPYLIARHWNAFYYKLSGATSWTTSPYGEVTTASWIPRDYATFVIVDQDMASITLKRQQRPNTVLYFTGKFAGFNFRSGTTQNFTIESGGELNSNFASGSLTQGFEAGGGASLIVQSPATIMILTNSGTIRTKTLIYGRINELKQQAGLINDIEIESGGRINTLTMSGGTINTLNVNSGGTLQTLTKTNGNINLLSVSGQVSNITNSGGNLTTLNINRGGSINSLTVSGGSLTNLNLEADGSLDSLSVSGGSLTNLNLNGGNLGKISGNGGTINNINLNDFSIRISSTTEQWKNAQISDYGKKEHLYIDSSGPTITNISGSVTVDVTTGWEQNKVYEYNSIATGNKIQNKFNSTNVKAAPGLFINHYNNGFSLRLDATSSYGATILKNITLSYMRRATMTQNILDSMTTKSFRAGYKEEQDAQYQSIKDEMTRLTARDSKYTKQRKRDQKQLDKVRDNLAKNTLRQSKGVNLKKGYNTYELIDQLDKMFISYENDRNTRAFILPYGANSVAFGSSQSNSIEWAGGAIAGIQKNLKGAGVFGGFIGYEYSNLDNKISSTNINIQTNSIQAGANVFKTYSSSSKPREFYIKSSLHASLELPQLSFVALGATQNIKPFMYSAGVDVRGGMTHFFIKRNSYISPEIGLSYDMLGLNGFEIRTSDEIYPAHFWHFPQASLSVKYYKSWKNTFKTSATIGAKYNIFNNKNEARFTKGGQDDSAKIPLPPLYANLDVSAIWVLKKNNELSLSYTGVFFAKLGNDTNDGVSTAISLRFAHWF